MKKPEQKQWEALRNATGASILWQRHEDKHSPDIPDLSFCTPQGTPQGAGWVEMKTLSKWPARASTRVRIPHLAPGQVNWAMRRWVMGANCWMLLRVEEYDNWLLIDPHVMNAILHQELTQEEIIRESWKVWDSVPDGKSLSVELCRQSKDPAMGNESRPLADMIAW